MGKSKAKAMAMAIFEDGGFVPNSSLVIKINEETKRRKTREAQLTEKREEREAEEKKKKEEYDKPLPDFPPRIPQEVRGKFFQYVARVVSDTLWNLENSEYQDDPFGYEQENATILGEEIPAKKIKPPRKKVPAECLKAALRVAQLEDGWYGEPDRQKKIEELKKKVCLQVSMHILIDTKHACFDENDRVWLNTYLGGNHFDRRIEYRIKRNLWKNVPYFASFDSNNQNGDSATRIVKWDVQRQQDDFELLKKSGYLGPDEEKVVHLEIF